MKHATIGTSGNDSIRSYSGSDANEIENRYVAGLAGDDTVEAVRSEDSRVSHYL